jgi:hypothetical protein
MATYKRIDGDYNITTINSDDNVNITTHTVVVNGNLKVEGDVTYIDVTELNITDPFIMLNSSNTPANANSYYSNSGILTHKTESDFAGLRWNNVTEVWEVSANTSTSGTTGVWEQLATVSSAALAAGANTEVQFNDGPYFGASSNFTFNKDTSELELTGTLVLNNSGTVPGNIANGAALYYAAEGGGGTSIYFKTATAQDELISRAKAIVFSLIF